MNTIKNLLLAFCLLSVPFFSACGKDDDPDPCNWSTELQAEVTAFSAALTAYSQNPSQENCIAYKNSLTAYLNAADDIDDCVPADQRAAFEASLDDAQIQADLLVC